MKTLVLVRDRLGHNRKLYLGSSGFKDLNDMVLYRNSQTGRNMELRQKYQCVIHTYKRLESTWKPDTRAVTGGGRTVAIN